MYRSSQIATFVVFPAKSALPAVKLRKCTITGLKVKGSVPQLAFGRCRFALVKFQMQSSPSSDDADAKSTQIMPNALPDPTYRETDERGFVVPVVGDVVLHPGRWANEDAAALVENVRYLPKRGTTVVDVVEMRNIGSDLYVLVKKRKWYDVAQVRIAQDTEYVAKQDAYRIKSARSGYAVVAPMSPQEKAAADEEYLRLKFRLLQTTAAAGGLGMILTALLGGWKIAYPFSLGAASSLLYLYLLQGSVDNVGLRTNLVKNAIFGARFIVPALPFLALWVQASGEGHRSLSVSGVASLLGSIPKAQAGAAVLGLLMYKVPLLAQTGAEAVHSLAEAEIGKGTTGMLGTSLVLAARAVKRKSSAMSDTAQPPKGSSGKQSKPIVFVFAGPSGSGKSTIIRKLFKNLPGVFEFCVSHTTREPRSREKDGVNYYFVSKQKFMAMIQGNEFVEYAQVHGNYYGTSHEAINKVLQSGKACILDLDVQGVTTLSKQENLSWSPRFVWIAPPSIEELEKRLRDRGSEDEDTLSTRLDTAIREMEFVATSSIFDRIILNKDISVAYEELRSFIEETLVDATT